jgi:hypothetical protein
MAFPSNTARRSQRRTAASEARLQTAEIKADTKPSMV